MIKDIYLSVQVGDLEGFLQRSQLGLLQELDGGEKVLGAIVHTHGDIGKLISRNIKLLSSKINVLNNYLDNSFASLLLNEQVTTDAKRRARRSRFANAGGGVTYIVILVFLTIFEQT